MYIIYYKHMIVYISCFNWDFSFITEDFLKTNKKKKTCPLRTEALCSSSFSERRKDFSDGFALKTMKRKRRKANFDVPKLDRTLWRTHQPTSTSWLVAAETRLDKKP